MSHVNLTQIIEKMKLENLDTGNRCQGDQNHPAGHQQAGAADGGVF